MGKEGRRIRKPHISSRVDRFLHNKPSGSDKKSSDPPLSPSRAAALNRSNTSPRKVEFHTQRKLREEAFDECRRARAEGLVALNLWPAGRDPPTVQDNKSLEVQSLWERFINAARAAVPSEMISLSIDELREFLRSFNERYDTWNEEMQLDYLHRPDLLRKSLVMPNVSFIEAQIVMRYLTTQLGGMADAIREKRPFTTTHSIEAMYLFSVLTRVPDNRQAFSLDTVVETLVTVFKMILVGFQGLFSENVRVHGQVADEQRCAQVVLAYGFQVIVNLTTHGGVWSGFEPEELLYHYAEDERRCIIQTKRALTRLGILNIIKGYADHLALNAQRAPLQGSQVEFRLLLLHTLGALLAHSSEMKSALIPSGLLDTLVQWIGWPPSYATPLAPGQIVSAASDPTLRSEFRMQLLCLQIFATSGRTFPANLQRVSLLNGWEQVQLFLLWTTEVFSINPMLMRERLSHETRASQRIAWNSAELGSRKGAGEEEPAPIPKRKILRPSPVLRGEVTKLLPLSYPQMDPLVVTKELAALFDALLDLSSYSDEDAQRVAVSPLVTRCQGREVEEVPIVPSIGVRITIDIISNLFATRVPAGSYDTVQRIREKIKACPELQLHILQAVGRMISKLRNIQLLLDHTQFWSTILTSPFYGFTEQTVPCHAPLAAEAHFKEQRRMITDLILYASSKDAYGSLELCEAIITRLQNCGDDLRRADELIQLLDAMVKRNPAPVQFTLCRLNIFPTLALVAQQYAALAAFYGHSHPETERNMAFSQDFFIQCRFRLLSVLGHLLSDSEENKLMAIQDESLLHILFQMLFEPSMRRYALPHLLHLMAVSVDIDSGMASSTAKDTLERLYRRYFALCARTQQSALATSFQLLLSLIGGISEIIAINHRSLKVFRKVDVFQQLVNILGAETRPKRRPVLFLHVLDAIQALVQRHEPNKQLLRQVVGYDVLLRHLRVILHEAPSDFHPAAFCETLLNGLFSILVDSEWDLSITSSNPATAPIIHFPDLIPFLFRVMRLLPTDYQEELLARFETLLIRCPLNQSVCSDQQLLYHLLDLVPIMPRDSVALSHMVHLIEILGSYSITVKELKKLFLQLKSKPGDFRPWYQLRLMKSLQFMALSRRSIGPETFFDLNGTTSALVIPPLEKWPPVTGYTFCLSFRVESLLDPAPGSGGGEPYFPRLVSFLDEAGCGLEIFIRPTPLIDDRSFHIEVDSHSLNGRSSSHCFSQIVKPALRTRQWYFLILTHRNNDRKFKIGDSELKLCINAEVPEKTSFRYPQFSTSLNKLRVGTNVEFKGSAPGSRQLRRAHFFCGQLGPFFLLDDAVTTMQSKFLFDKVVNGDLALYGTAAFGELESRIRRYYNCTARVGKSFIDLSPEKNSDRASDAKMIGKLHVCRTRDIKDIIHCIGGIKVLLPLFAQIDQPEEPPQADGPINYETNKKLLLQTLGLLSDMMNRSATNMKEITRCEGFRVVGFLLEQSSPTHLTSEVLLMLEDMGHKFSTVDSNAVWQHLIFRWAIWMHAPPKVQWEVANLLLTLTTKYPRKAQELVSVQQILDVMYFYYWYEPCGLGARGQEPCLHPVTKQVLGARPSKKDLATIRRCLFQVIEKLWFTHGASQEDVRAYLAALMETADRQQLIELLTFLYEMLHERVLPSLHATLMEVSATPVFLMLMKSTEDDVCILSLRIVAKLTDAKKATHRSDTLASIPRIIEQLTLPIYQALLSILVGQQNVDPTLIDEKLEIVAPVWLPVLFRLLLRADILLRQQALQGLSLLLSNSLHNRDVLLEGGMWKEWLMGLLIHPCPGMSPGSHQASSDMVYNIFQLLLTQLVTRTRTAGRELYDMLSYLLLLESRGLVEKETIFRSILLRVFGVLVQQGRDKSNQSNVFHNLLVMVAVIEEFLFFFPTQETITILQTQECIVDPELIEAYERFVIFGAPPPSQLPRHYFPSAQVNHAALHRADTLPAVWKDLALARAYLQVLSLYQAFDAAQNGTVEHTLGSKEVVKVYPWLRAGGFLRITLRIALTILSYGDTAACVETIPRVRQMVQGEYSKGESTPRLIYVLSFLLLILKRVVEEQNQDARSADKSKALVPLVKDLLRVCKKSLPPSCSNEVAQSAANSTIPQFLKLFTTPSWNLIIQWAEQRVKDIINDDATLQSLDKVRSKTTATLLETGSALPSEVRENYMRRLFHDVHDTVLSKEIERKRLECRQASADRIYERRIWRHMLRSLTNERAPWASDDEGRTYWKLGKTENFSRMRLKMKRNYHFDPHLDAAKHPDELVPESPADQSDSELKPIHASGMKLLDSAASHDGTDALSPMEEADLEKSLAEQRTTAGSGGPAKLLYQCPCQMVTPLHVIEGTLVLSTWSLHFTEATPTLSEADLASLTSEIVHPDTPPSQAAASPLAKEWTLLLQQLAEVHLRRHLLRPSALEIFLKDRSNYFFNFSKRDRQKIHSKLVALAAHLPNLTYVQSDPPSLVLSRSDLTRKWQQRKLSNFDYLMQLNTIAGRSFNDITQYPVFPWVLSDYTSTHLRLDDPAVYRDLSKPVGALEPERLKQFILRYENFMDEDIPQFHYGSHYSSAGIVLFYLVRMEPFTTQAITLQGGTFDHADRMFDSIPNCWRNVLTNAADVKELIPEFFFQPHFLSNHNHFHFGQLQTGEPLHHVQLPAWAHSAEEFIHRHREALESEYVSSHLHEWIDLIFGFKQRGPAAIDAHNVFYYLTYEGAVDLDSITDECQRIATEAQIDNFGQTPSQLLTKAHPARFPFHEAHQTIFVRMVHRLKPQTYQIPVASETDSICFVCMPSFYFTTSSLADYSEPPHSDILLTVTRTRLVGVHKFMLEPHISDSSLMQSAGTHGSHATVTMTAPLGGPPFTFQIDPSFAPALNTLAQRVKIGAPFAYDIKVDRQCFACTRDASVILSCGHWDCSIKCSSLDGSRPLQSLMAHKDIVTCLAISVDGEVFVSGSRDTTVLVWDILPAGKGGSGTRVNDSPRYILYGHSDDVTCVMVDVGCDVVISGSKDGSCILHNLKDGTYLRSLYHPTRCAIELVAISSLGYVLFYSREDSTVFVHTLNGELVASGRTEGEIRDLCVSRDGRYLVLGDRQGTLAVHVLFTMECIQRIPVGGPVVSITLTPDEVCLIVALANGSLVSVLVEEYAQLSYSAEMPAK